jgi:hypothetical protein
LLLSIIVEFVCGVIDRLIRFIFLVRFIKNNGKIPRAALLTVLLVSSCVCLKFWEEEGKKWVDFKVTSRLSGLSVSVISRLERSFLQAIDWPLLLQQADIDTWKQSLATPPVFESSPMELSGSSSY